MHRNTWPRNVSRVMQRVRRRRLAQDRRSRAATLQPLEPRMLLAADPTISEFQAINVTTLADDDGEFSDWIEIRNSDAEPVNLDGWYLTDDEDNLQKWRFPAVMVEANSQIVVFASNKDRVDPENPLHTNFRLGGDGDYLALVRPDGTVSMDFGTQYPPQVEDQSYGMAIGRDVVELIAENANVSATVPTDNSLENTWTEPAFDDGAWFQGNLGVGYEVLAPGMEERDDFSGPLDPSWTVDLPAGGTSTVEVVDGNLRLTVPSDQDTTFTDRLIAPIVRRSLPGSPADYEIIAKVTQGSLDKGIAGIGVVDGANGRLAVQLEYASGLNFRLFAGGRSQSSRVSIGQDEYFLRLVRQGIEKTWTAYFKTDQADDWTEVGEAVDGVDGTPTLTDPQIALFARTPSGTVTANFDSFELVVPDQRPVYGPDIDLNIGNEMFDNNASVYLRIPFDVAGDPTRFDEMVLSTRFDDGFRAYLNGTLVAEENVPIEATWNSTASSEFGAVNGRIPTVQLPLTKSISALRPGENVLSIHGMNISALDGDFFFDAQMIASDILSETEQFFTRPTPNEPNDLPAAPVPNVVGEEGVFFGSQVVELTLDDPDPSLEIRYTLDGTEPTIESTLYTGPITLTESAMLEARTFDPSGQRRFDPSNSASGTFFAVAEELRGVTSDIPLVVLDTLGQRVPGSSSTSLRATNVAFFSVSKASGRSTIDGIVDYLGRGGIRDRGSSTAGQSKPNLTFETWGPDGTTQDDDADVSLAGLPADSDWVLHAPFNFDRALIRNQFFFGLSNRIGRWAPHTVAVEVYLNRRDGVVTEGDYAGTYVLMEKIKRGEDRVDITRITPEDNDPNSEEISGGYIWKIDRADPGEPGFSAGGQTLNWVEPKSPRGRADDDQKATLEQQEWVQDYFNAFRETLRSPDITDPEGYTKYLDVGAAIDHHLINVLTFNVDALRLSGYLYKDRGKPIEFGPLWDCDRCMESTDGRDDDPLKWFDGGGTSFFTYPWWRELFQTADFWQAYIDRWQELRRDDFSREGIDDLIDQLANEVEESSQRNIDRWRQRPRTSSAWASGKLDGTWRGEVEHMRHWLHARADFMDANFVQPVQYVVDGQVLGHVPGVKLDPGQEVSIVGPPVVFFDDAKLVSGTLGETTARYFVPTDDSLADTWTAADFDDAAWSVGPTGIGFDNPTGGDFSDLILTEVQPNEVAAGGTTILTRIPFVVDNLAEIADKDLVLRMKYDDGFVAYLNGTVVHEQNLRDDLAWDSRAQSRRSSRDSEIARNYEDFDLSEFSHLLVEGRNVLAIRGINSSSTSGDMLILPELVSRTVRFETNPNAKVFYTTDGSDPRDFGGAPSASAIELKTGETIAVSENMRIVARNFDDVTDRGSDSRIVETDWSSPLQYDFVVSPAELVISEVNYNPGEASDDEVAAGFGNDDFEFVEILNNGAAAADLVGVQLTDGVEFDFYNSDIRSLGPGERLVVVRNAAAFQMRYGDNLPVAGVYRGELDNAGEDVDLVDGTGSVVFSVNYSDNDPWPVRADGAGATLQLVDPATVTPESQSKWYRWRGSTEVNGSPGTAGRGPVGVVINELLARTEAPVNLTDSIELHNTTGAPLDIGGWGLSDSNNNHFKFNIPAGTVIPAGGYVVFDEGDFNPANPPAGNDGFGLNGREGESVWLVQADGSFVDDVHFRATLNGESLGRTPNATGRLAPLARNSFGLENSVPRVGPIVMTEVQYNPVLSDAAIGIDPNLDASDLEFIEIHNPTATAEDLTDWRLRGGVEFDFDDGTTLAAGETIVILKFNPDNPENVNRLNAFRGHYGIGDQVRLLGGYSGQLNNSDDKILLLRPQTPEQDEPDLVIHVQEDEVLYDDLAPWPVTADGTGHSLQRRAPDAFGNDARSWVATIPTPGMPDATLRGDFNGDGVLDQTDINLLFEQTRAPNPDLSFDLTGDSLVNENDRDEMILNVVRTSYGDSNLDLVFNSSDLVLVFQAGEFEDGIPLNSVWETGDWNADGDFSSSDIVLAFQGGGYVPAIPGRVDPVNRVSVAAALVQDSFADALDASVDTLVPHLAAQRPLNRATRVEMVDETLETLFASDRVERVARTDQAVDSHDELFSEDEFEI